MYFNTRKYGGHLSDEDMNVMFDLRNNEKTIGDWINYLMKTYTPDKVKELIHLSGYSELDNRHDYKIDKIQGT
jgi:hypothetical protein